MPQKELYNWIAYKFLFRCETEMCVIVRFEVLVTVTKIIRAILETYVSRYHILEHNSSHTEKCIHFLMSVCVH
jgi:hypothetical protein